MERVAEEHPYVLEIIKEIDVCTLTKKRGESKKCKREAGNRQTPQRFDDSLFGARKRKAKGQEGNANYYESADQ